ncbi:MAG: HD domain-containing protein [Patescibacteria group bacterium]
MKLTQKIQKAINIASKLHLGQIRKGEGDLPYISHPYSVACILSEYTNNEDIIVAGILHDVLEDVKGYYYADLAKEFGEEVAKIVKGVSEDKDPNIENDEKATWEKRKNKYLDNLKDESQESMMVCCADKIHNLRSMIEAYKQQGDKLWERFNSPADKKIWFYEEVLDILKGKINSKIVKALEHEISIIKELMNKYQQELFIGFTMSESGDFFVRLINNSHVCYSKVKIFTGAYMSMDDDLLETSKVVRSRGELKPKSFIQIDKSDWDELDFIIWYHLDFYNDKGQLVKKSWFQLPKYGLGYDENELMLPIVQEKGVIIELDERDGEVIDEIVDHTDMNSKLHKRD